MTDARIEFYEKLYEAGEQLDAVRSRQAILALIAYIKELKTELKTSIAFDKGD